MAFDAALLRGVVWELVSHLTDGKVEKVLQPGKDEIHLLVRAGGDSHRVCIRAGSHMPRISLTYEPKENPPTPPMFCMLLRKHLGGARLLRVTQVGYERIVRMSFSGYDEMGFACEKHLVAEIIGKYSNLILLDAQDKILGVLRAVDFSTSRVRQLLPGMKYELPPAQDKRPPLEETEEGFLSLLAKADPAVPCDKHLTDTYLGTARQVARQLAFEASGQTDTPVGEVDPHRLWDAFSDRMRDLAAHIYQPTAVVDARGGVLDYSYGAITYFGESGTVKCFDTLSRMLDYCFVTQEKRERISARARDLTALVERAEARLTRKLQLQLEELADAREAKRYQRLGDLLTANLWRVKRGDTSLVTEDFYEEGTPTVEIPLDSRLSGAANAQRYYKLYAKAKRAEEHLTAEIEKCRAELAYLDTVKVFLEHAEGEQDLQEVREELYRSGYASRMKGYTSPKQLKLKPMEFTSPSGYRVLVGRNNMQNDTLTFRLASKGDLWFHVKGMPGSHVVLVCDGAEPPAEDYTFAAQLAAKYSRASGEGIAVDYTRVRYVKKPPGSRPGFVTYSTNYTAFVTAED